MDVEALEQRLGHTFANGNLLKQALTHRSYGQPNNERLEFLGDSVLNCAIAALLFERFPSEDEGDLSRLRAFLVKQQSLYRVAQRLGFGELLLLGEGESRSGGFRRPSILADALEALIGAVYLDAGFDLARAMIGRLYEPELAAADPKTTGKDAKTRLQEELQRQRLPLPVYSVVATHGAAHSQTFEVDCQIPKLEVSVSGTGGTRRAAEQAAAELALGALARHGAVNRSEKAPARSGRVGRPRKNAKNSNPVNGTGVTDGGGGDIPVQTPVASPRKGGARKSAARKSNESTSGGQG